jgi:molybdopterin-guanine dinucleotide biosynthesis protein A
VETFVHQRQEMLRQPSWRQPTRRGIDKRADGRAAQTDSMTEYAALVLAGGTSRRLGGVDKAGIDVGGQTLLERALDAVAGASARIVVGPARPCVWADVTSVCEDPPGGGPVAAIEAGLGYVARDVVVVLACDMPFVTPRLVNTLVDTLVHSPGATASGKPLDGVTLRDSDGRRQPLAAAYRTASLRRTIASLPSARGASMRQLLGKLELEELPAGGITALDCDTWESVAACRAEMARAEGAEQR